MEIEKPQKTPNEFICITCDFKCCNKKDYNRHLSTRKHKMVVNGSRKVLKNNHDIKEE